MSCLYYRDSELYIENVSLQSVAAKFGTPAYLYSRKTLEQNWQNFNNSFSIPHLICYAVKANSNIGILRLLAKLNSGFDIVSVGELKRVIAAGGDTQKIIFSGVGKTKTEIEQAITHNIYCFNVESEPELLRLNSIALNLQKKINVALRINPNVNPQTHFHIATGLKENKFGIDINVALNIAKKITQLPSLNLIGLACHIGSQLTKLEPFLLAFDHLLKLYLDLREMDIHIEHINMGGGLGINYQNENPPTITDYAKSIEKEIAKYPLKLIIEPGRAIVGNAGVLLTRIEYIKESQHKNFIVVDAGMNDLLRPALYNAWQKILPVHERATEKKLYDIAGPVCESADFLGKNRELAIQESDLLAVDCAGAYGFSMSSNYNSRCKPVEILIDNNQMHLIRRRETIEEMLSLEI